MGDRIGNGCVERRGVSTEPGDVIGRLDGRLHALDGQERGQVGRVLPLVSPFERGQVGRCLLYTSDAADE